MRKLTELLNESKKIHPVLCLKVNGQVNPPLDKKDEYKNATWYAIFLMPDDSDPGWYIFPEFDVLDPKTVGEMWKVCDALDKVNYDGYKAAVALDRENDLHEITKEEAEKYTKHISWFAKWWKEDGGQPWIVDAQK